MPIGADEVQRQLLAVLKEAFEGSSESWTYFTDRGAAYADTLGELSAAEASRPLGGTTIAAHVHHVIFGLDVCAAWVAGDRRIADWKESWAVSEVDEAAWVDLSEDLRRAYLSFRDTVSRHALDDEIAFGVAVGTAAHLAAHLGAIRQKLQFARAEQ